MAPAQGLDIGEIKLLLRCYVLDTTDMVFVGYEYQYFFILICCLKDHGQ